MLVASVLSLSFAAVLALLGGRALTRPASGDSTEQAMRSIAPTQLAAAAMLAAGGAVGLSAGPWAGLLWLCAIGALATVTTGIWRGAQYAQANTQPARPANCQAPGDQACANCKLNASAWREVRPKRTE